MLVLSRHEQEGIAIELPDGTVGWVVVTEIDAGLKRPRVRIGLKFPASVRISRHELLPSAALADAPIALTE